MALAAPAPNQTPYQGFASYRSGSQHPNGQQFSHSSSPTSNLHSPREQSYPIPGQGKYSNTKERYEEAYNWHKEQVSKVDRDSQFPDTNSRYRAYENHPSQESFQNARPKEKGRLRRFWDYVKSKFSRSKRQTASIDHREYSNFPSYSNNRPLNDYRQEGFKRRDHQESQEESNPQTRFAKDQSTTGSEKSSTSAQSRRFTTDTGESSTSTHKSRPSIDNENIESSISTQPRRTTADDEEISTHSRRSAHENGQSSRSTISSRPANPPGEKSKFENLPTLKLSDLKDKGLAPAMLEIDGLKEFNRFKAKDDGHCGFRSISLALFGTQDKFMQVREKILEAYQSNPKILDANDRDLKTSEMMHKLKDYNKNPSGSCGAECYLDDDGLIIAANMLSRPIAVYSTSKDIIDTNGNIVPNGAQQPRIYFPQKSTAKNWGEPIVLGMENNNHFDLLVPNSQKFTATAEKPTQIYPPHLKTDQATQILKDMKEKGWDFQGNFLAFGDK